MAWSDENSQYDVTVKQDMHYFFLKNHVVIKAWKYFALGERTITNNHCVIKIMKCLPRGNIGYVQSSAKPRSEQKRFLCLHTLRGYRFYSSFMGETLSLPAAKNGGKCNAKLRKLMSLPFATLVRLFYGTTSISTYWDYFILTRIIYRR